MRENKNEQTEEEWLSEMMEDIEEDELDIIDRGRPPKEEK